MRFALPMLAALALASGAWGSPPPLQLGAQTSGQPAATVVLHWSNATTPTVEVYRDDVLLQITANVPAYPGLTIEQQPAGQHVYKVCEPATLLHPGRCSNPATAVVH